MLNAVQDTATCHMITGLVLFHRRQCTKPPAQSTWLALQFETQGDIRWSFENQNRSPTCMLLSHSVLIIRLMTRYKCCEAEAVVMLWPALHDWYLVQPRCMTCGRISQNVYWVPPIDASLNFAFISLRNIGRRQCPTTLRDLLAFFISAQVIVSFSITLFGVLFNVFLRSSVSRWPEEVHLKDSSVILLLDFFIVWPVRLHFCFWLSASPCLMVKQ